MRSFLVVGDYNRQDFIMPFFNLPSSIKLYFIEHPDQSFVKNDIVLPINSEIIYWKDYSDAFHLLRQIQVEKIFYYFIEAYNHAALRVAASELGINNVHVEHGLRFNMHVPIISASKNGNISKPSPISINRIKNFSFFICTLIKAKNHNKFSLTKFFWHRRKGIKHIFHPDIISITTPDNFISFSSEIFKHHIIKLNLSNFPVIYTGIPQFDRLVTLDSTKELQQNLVFIDQPLVEHGVMGWTEKHRLHLLNEIIRICKKQSRKLLIKIHPASNLEFWQSIANANSDSVVILDNTSFEDALASNWIVFGYSSTLLLPIVSLPHTAVFCLDMHPIDVAVKQSSLLTDAGVACAISSFSEIEDALNRAEEEQQKQKPFKAAFTQKYLYKADGRSTERFVEAILS